MNNKVKLLIPIKLKKSMIGGSDYESIIWVDGKVGLDFKPGKPFTPEWIKKLIPLPLKKLLYFLIKKIRTLIKYLKKIVFNPLINFFKIHISPTGSMNSRFFKKT